MKNFYQGLFILLTTSSLNLLGKLPDNISDLVDESAPAVVNITAKKNYLEGLPLDMGVFLMKCLSDLEFQETLENHLSKKERRCPMALVLS